MHVRGLPPATQEGLLQQVLEKHALVKRVELFTSQNEAVVELENAAVSPMASSVRQSPSIRIPFAIVGSWKTSFAN